MIPCFNKTVKVGCNLELIFTTVQRVSYQPSLCVAVNIYIYCKVKQDLLTIWSKRDQQSRVSLMPLDDINVFNFLRSLFSAEHSIHLMHEGLRVIARATSIKCGCLIQLSDTVYRNKIVMAIMFILIIIMQSKGKCQNQEKIVYSGCSLNDHLKNEYILGLHDFGTMVEVYILESPGHLLVITSSK